ncbi:MULTISPECIES: AraC family ligand binding domain-containing protein [Paenibacillus]
MSFHYFEYAQGFVFSGEQHDFWELLYVTRGRWRFRPTTGRWNCGRGR